MKRLVKKDRKLAANDDLLCASEIQEAEILCFKSIQKQFHKSKIDSLKSTREVSK